MKYTQKEPKAYVLFALLAVAVSSGIYSYNLNVQELPHAAAPEEPQILPCTSCEAEAVSSTDERSAAHRLQQRMMSQGGTLPGIAVIEHALAERERYERLTVTLHIEDSFKKSSEKKELTIDFSKHPELLTLNRTWSSVSFVLDRDLLQQYIQTGVFGDPLEHQSIHVKESYMDGKVLRAKNVETARSGFQYDFTNIAEAVESAMRTQTESVHIAAPYVEATVDVSLDGNNHSLTLLATGTSDFSNSPEERVWNVHKAVDERVHNIIVPKGSTFSFVDTLGGPVTLQKGWKEGMGLFGGGAALTPGAGICQAATTVYRAALLAGLPITYKRNHSMFVDHYEPYGVGLDATVFPGVHDLLFKNDTAGILLIQSYTVGDTVFVHFYGVDDGRSVALDGPYFNTTPQKSSQLRPLGYDEIGWVHTVFYADGTTKVRPIVATYYKGFPRSVKEKYAGTPGIQLLSTLAPKNMHAAASTEH